MQVRLHGAGVTHDTGAPAIIMQVRLHSWCRCDCTYDAGATALIRDP
jgi:hypothetical protein